MTKDTDRRIRRTQQLLRAGLFQLIQEKGYERLSVQNIIDRANIGRATFYTHFDNKEDLLLSGFDLLKQSLRQDRRARLTSGVAIEEQAFGFSHDLLCHISEHRHLFTAMVGKTSGMTVQNALRKLILDLVKDDLELICSERESRNCAIEAAEFITGGLLDLILWWLSKREQLSAGDINVLFRRFAIPLTRVACAPPQQERERLDSSNKDAIP